MTNTKSIEDKNTSSVHYSAKYGNDSTYKVTDCPSSNSASKESDHAPRRVISEASFKARARNNINY